MSQPSIANYHFYRGIKTNPSSNREQPVFRAFSKDLTAGSRVFSRKNTAGPTEKSVFNKVVNSTFFNSRPAKPIPISEKQSYFGKNAQESNFRRILRGSGESKTTDDSLLVFSRKKEVSPGYSFKKAVSPYKTTRIPSKKERKEVPRNLCCADFGTAENANLFNRDYMEDTYRVVESFNGDQKQTLFTLYDGHGGSECSAAVRDKFPAVLARFSDIDLVSAMSMAYREMNYLLEKEGFQWCGCTATTALVRRNLYNGTRDLVVANVGDSRAVMVKKSGAVTRLTYDHKGTDFKEAERVKRAGGQVIFGRVGCQLALTRAFGDFTFKNQGVTAEPFVYKTYVQDMDKLLVIASDGVWDVIEDEQLPQLLDASQSAKKIAEQLVREAMIRGSKDNISCVVVVLN